MKIWTPQHAALLGALRAERLVPHLFRRLSLERYVVDDEELARLHDWPSTLMRDPGWEIIEPVLERPVAWPAAWHQACERGWSPMSDHHHALLFDRLTARMLRDGEYEQAQWAWIEALSAWARVAETDYLERLLGDLVEVSADAEEDPEAQATREQVVRELLVPMIAERAQDLQEALGLLNAQPSGGIERRRARFAWSALELTREILGRAGRRDTLGMLARAAREVERVTETIVGEVIARFEQHYSALELSTVGAEALLAPFEWISAVASLIGHHEAASIHVVRTVVELGWTLRRMGRDEDPKAGFAKVLQTTEGFNLDLEKRLLSRDVLGNNSKCADFLVFQGELERAPKRSALFERGLKVCPGHRNSAMLLSYDKLNEANSVLVQLAATSSVSRMVPSSARHNEEQVLRAHDLILSATRLYPSNDALPGYTSRLEEAAARLHITLPERDPS